MKKGIANMFYNVSVFDYHGRECEIRIYEKPIFNGGVKCDEYGVIKARYEHWLNDDWCPFVDGFDESEIVDGMVKVHDIDEIEDRAKKSAQCSFSRTRSRVYQLARGNEWLWFITFTFDKRKCDRYDWIGTSVRLKEYLGYMRKKHIEAGYDFKYMVVPEQHKDGAFHFHGIFGSCDSHLLQIKRYLPDKGFWLVDSWHWGFSSATQVKDDLAVSNYITKYFTKDMMAVSKGKKRYWASRNLSLPERCNLGVRAQDESGIRVPIQEALLDSITHSSVVEGPAGSVTYLQCNVSAAEVIDALCNANVVVEEAELCGAGN